jgi:hypothetical protein
MAVRVAVLTKERHNYQLCGTVYTQAWVPARVSLLSGQTHLGFLYFSDRCLYLKIRHKNQCT